MAAIVARAIRLLSALLAPGDGADDGDRERAALEVGVNRFLGEEERVLHVVAAAREALPLRQRAQLDERREQELARRLEEDLPAFDLEADVDQARALQPARDAFGVGQRRDVPI